MRPFNVMTSPVPQLSVTSGKLITERAALVSELPEHVHTFRGGEEPIGAGSKLKAAVKS